MMNQTVFKDFVRLQRGFDLPRQNRKDGNIPVVGATQIQGYHNQSKVSAPGVTTGRSGALGAVMYLTEDFWPLNTCLWVKDFKGNETRYVYYKLKTLNLKRFNSGAGVPTLNRNHLDTLPIDIHGRDSQQTISGILGAYDDLIENNSKRIEKLETMARLYYYQGLSENTTRTAISEVSSLVGRGISPRYDDNSDSLVINQRCIREQKIDITVARRQSKLIPEAKLIRRGDVLINSTGVGTLGRVAQVFEEYENTTVDSHVTIVRPNKLVDPYFFGAAMLNRQDAFERLGVGATGQTELGRDAIGRVELFFPSLETQRIIGDEIKVIRNLISNLQHKSQNLVQARDLLLPRLMAGEIEV